MADASLFLKAIGDKVVVVQVYVGDLIIMGDLDDEILPLKKNLCTRFHMKDLGKLNHFLGLEVNYEDIVLHQRKYMIYLLK